MGKDERKQSRAKGSRRRGSRAKKYQQPTRCSVGRVTIEGAEQPAKNFVFTPIKPRFERKKKTPSQEQAPQPPSSSSTTKNKEKNRAGQIWVQKILEGGIRDIRKSFMDTVKPYAPIGEREAFKMEANFEKNRYDDVELLDKTRIKLKGTPDCSDYIHASAVQVTPEMTVICAQGPLENTIEQFWIMVVEQSCKVVLQLCQFTEDGKEKSVPYFPAADQGAEQEYGSVKLRVVSRKMDVGAMKKMERTLVEVTFAGGIFETTHLLFSGWPDHSVPESLSTYLDMRSLIRRLADKRPVVAHCSAGIGRSGSYTAIEMAYYELTGRQNRNFNMIEMMRQLRDQRSQAVQNDQQYLFVHRVVLEVLLSEKVIEKTEKVAQFCKDYEDLIERKKAEGGKQKKKK